MKKTVFLFDVDNVLIEHDSVKENYREFLENKIGTKSSERYWEIYENLRDELGYADYLGALQKFRVEYIHDTNLPAVSEYFVNYPFENHLFPNALEVLKYCKQFGETVILTDGDIIFQPIKIRRSGLLEAVGENVLIYIDKKKELAEVEKHYPAEHYVLVDDKVQILSAVKKIWGERVTTVFPKQGHYACDEKEIAKYPKPDITIEKIGDLMNFNLEELLNAS